MALKQNAPTVFPTLRYDDAETGLRFLVDTLGLTRGPVHRGDDGRIEHAEVGWGTGVIMLGTRRPDSPFDPGRGCLYLVTEDPDALHARAAAAGAEIVMELTDQDYGSREFAVADPEGNRWSFGTYQPDPLTPADHREPSSA